MYIKICKSCKHIINNFGWDLYVYEMKIFTSPRDKKYLTHAHICFLIHHSLAILITFPIRETHRSLSSHLHESRGPKDRPWPAGSTSDSPFGTSKNAFFGFDEQNGSLYVLRARLGPARRGKALETNGAGTQKLRLLHPVASASRCTRDSIACLTLFGRWGGGSLLFLERIMRIAWHGVPRRTNNNTCETTNKKLRRNTGLVHHCTLTRPKWSLKHQVTELFQLLIADIRYRNETLFRCLKALELMRLVRKCIF